VTPSFPRLRKLDAAWFRAEQWLCGGLFLLMALLVFASVVRDIFGSRHSPIDAAALFLAAAAVVRTRVVREGETRLSWARTFAVAAAVTILVALAVEIYVRALPGGFVWAPKMALCLMLWVAFFGASMATYERAHLALEFGEKIWPKAARHVVRAFAHALTSAFCLALGWLSIVSIRAHHASWALADGFADNVPSMDWLPQWAVFLIFPYVFFAMTIRLLAQTYTIASGTEETGKESLPT
jgi:TRAP-type C4-dicarboxylate transport system permease small subunit